MKIWENCLDLIKKKIEKLEKIQDYGVFLLGLIKFMPFNFAIYFV